MNIQAGKRYVMRNGQVTGEMIWYGHEDYPWLDADGLIWTPTGKYWADGSYSKHDIIREYQPDTPAATITTSRDLAILQVRAEQLARDIERALATMQDKTIHDNAMEHVRASIAKVIEAAGVVA